MFPLINSLIVSEPTRRHLRPSAMLPFFPCRFVPAPDGHLFFRATFSFSILPPGPRAARRPRLFPRNTYPHVFNVDELLLILFIPGPLNKAVRPFLVDPTPSWPPEFLLTP